MWISHSFFSLSIFALFFVLEDLPTTLRCRREEAVSDPNHRNNLSLRMEDYGPLASLAVYRIRECKGGGLHVLP